METNKQKFTIEFEYPIMDAKVTAEELREIIGIGLKCFGQLKVAGTFALDSEI